MVDVWLAYGETGPKRYGRKVKTLTFQVGLFMIKRTVLLDVLSVHPFLFIAENDHADSGKEIWKEGQDETCDISTNREQQCFR